MVSFYDKYLGRRRDTLTSSVHVQESGYVAGLNMASSTPSPYVFQPFVEFWFGKDFLRATGILSPNMQTVGIFEKPKGTEPSEEDLTRGYNLNLKKKKDLNFFFQKISTQKFFFLGYVYYIDDYNRVAGIVSLNIFGRTSDVVRVLGTRVKGLDRDHMKNLLDIPEEENLDEEPATDNSQGSPKNESS